MIVDKDFVQNYNKLFKFLGEKGAEQFWHKLSKTILGELRELVERKGLAGCFEFWSNTLTQEGADCKITLDTKENTFEIEMRQCPSLAVLDKPSKGYCKHCWMYADVIEPLGYKYDLQYNGKGQCRIQISK